MPRVVRRTPLTEKASGYGYVDFLKDIVQRTVAETTAGFKRPLDFSDEEIMEMGFAGLGGGTKISKGLGKGKFPFNLKTTDLPLWDAILKKPAYHKKAKGLERRIEFMSPEEYMQRISKGSIGVSSKTQRANLYSEQIEKYSREMERGAKFPMPGIEYKKRLTNDLFDIIQEGRHRMLAAEKLGIDRVPVLIIKPKRELRFKTTEGLGAWKVPVTKPHLATSVPKFANMDETVMFVRELLKTPSRGAEYIPAMKQEMKWSAEKALKASKKPYSPEQFQEVMNEGVRRQWYREAYEVLSGRMPPWGEMP